MGKKRVSVGVDERKQLGRPNYGRCRQVLRRAASFTVPSATPYSAARDLVVSPSCLRRRMSRTADSVSFAAPFVSPTTAEEACCRSRAIWCSISANTRT